MTPETFATRPLRIPDHLEAWREWYHPVLDLLPKQPTDNAFPAEIHMWKIGRLGDEPNHRAVGLCLSDKEQPQG